jgi:hypothetical protein
MSLTVKSLWNVVILKRFVHEWKSTYKFNKASDLYDNETYVECPLCGDDIYGKQSHCMSCLKGMYNTKNLKWRTYY